jgi:rhamnopyranosyl-N-acetylglucosaminyl-diphospho-decaprenol beta-1,3/1,4-galactofuranosyltransferase
MEMMDRVVALVVTYNRKELLVECLRALLNQWHPLEKILVIDNASTDGTQDLLAETGLLAEHLILYRRLSENLGGAGGFETGMRWAYEELEWDWIWLMDDDSICTVNALKELLAASEELASWKPTLLASRVLYWDNDHEPCNVPRFRFNRPWGNGEPTARIYAAAEAGCIPIRNASFVAPLIRRSAVARYGFPNGGFFLLLDDIEYTGRILKEEFGVSVPRSVVYHKTKRAALAHEVTPGYFFFDLRNTLWMIRLSKAYYASEKFSFAAYTALTAIRFLLHWRFSKEAMKAAGRATLQGVFRKPRSIQSAGTNAGRT